MTLPKLCSAAEVWFLVLGDNKQAAVDAARNDSHSQLPAALVQRGAARTQWFLEKLF
jgi:6-phosphogluconolactonase/glucosamine-6-phosphate isomerase/deaminase